MTVNMHLAIRIAAEIILLPRFEIETLLKTIARRRPTLFPGVPTLFNALLRSEEHTSELQSLMRISYAVFCLKKKNTYINNEINGDLSKYNRYICLILEFHHEVRTLLMLVTTQ